MRIKAKLLQEMAQLGFMARVVPIERLRDLSESIETQHNNGQVDEALYQEYLKGFVFSPPENLPSARSIIVVASRQPQVRFTFYMKGVSHSVLVPPSYLHAADSDHKVRMSLASMLEPEGYQVVPAIVPKKLLAARSGLATYGRNNITYVEGMGSFHRLSAFYSDMPCDGDEPWEELKMLELCEDCGICEQKCPSGAISPGRFLLHAERCIVFHNEHPSNIPFPDWLDLSWHNCLVGCMLCQKACPKNKPYLKLIEDEAEFSPSETALMMAGTAQDDMPVPLVHKLELCDLLGMMDVIPRNLRVLLERVK